MAEFAEHVRLVASRCESFRESKAPEGYPDSLALCIVDSVQSTMVRYPTVENVISNYRAYRRERGGDPNKDSAADLAATFDQLNGHEAWAKRIGNGNRTSTAKGAPLKAYAIENEARAMINVDIITVQDLRTAAKDPDQLARVKQEWLKVPGQGPGVTWHYVQMLAGIPGIKPDRMIMRFVAHALGVPLKTITPSFCVKLLTAVADELDMPATALDHAIWSYQRTR
ncbi:hypothetical protein [Mycolicibacterium aubagnense]|uniref:Heme peroxidase n=1 Tax=Mycolicibacterium aubagnense TaxID=319707 RepID=A0ABM7IJK2_9MYCO|nr:hypothetical protein [Mycolicibacterium aubagnense]TLH66793.1 hypothetical protein C1S80_06915 [Mycolicibacterium aubagnense]WGI31617.1 hypothetical protein QDT91_20650 [Mycolicibacterium aubagnense]BBX86914.1 heme peroxidase [Mycolicibacterium aubagnense]